MRVSGILFLVLSFIAIPLDDSIIWATTFLASMMCFVSFVIVEEIKK